MDVLTPNKFAAFFELNSLDYESVQSYSQLNNRKNEINSEISKLKTKLHGLVVSRPVDIFTDNDDSGTVLDQLEKTEESLYTDLEQLYLEKNQLETLSDMVDLAYDIISRNDKYNNMSKEDKYNLAFDNVVYNEKSGIDLKNPKYYLHQPGAYNKYRDIIYSIKCNDRNITDIKHKVMDNIALYDYNDGRQLAPINNVFNTININGDGKRPVGYVIYIKDNSQQKHIFVNKSGQWLFNDREEAVEQLSTINGVSSLDYCTLDYIKEHKYMFDINCADSFFELYKKYDKDYKLTLDIITKIFNAYYNSYNICMNKVFFIMPDYNKYKQYFIDTVNDFVKKCFDMSETDFKPIMAEYYKTLCKSGIGKDFESDIAPDAPNIIQYKQANANIDKVIKWFTPYYLFNIFISVVIKHYLYDKVYEIKEIEF